MAAPTSDPNPNSAAHSPPLVFTDEVDEYFEFVDRDTLGDGQVPPVPPAAILSPGTNPPVNQVSDAHQPK